MSALTTMRKLRGAVVCAVLIGGCALIATPATSPEPSPKAAQLLATGDYMEAHLMRRFAEGHLVGAVAGRGRLVARSQRALLLVLDLRR